MDGLRYCAASSGPPRAVDPRTTTLLEMVIFQQRIGGVDRAKAAMLFKSARHLAAERLRSVVTSPIQSVVSASASPIGERGCMSGTAGAGRSLSPIASSAIRTRQAIPSTSGTPTHAGYAFVLSESESFGAGAAGIVLQPDAEGAAAAPATEIKGTLAEWQHGVARFAVGNDLLALFLAAAFAGPLLELMAEPSGGLHIHGKSQSGKTTALAVAASVWGRADTSGVIKSWRATANGLEGVAAQTTDTLLVLDEIGMADANQVGDIIYQLGSETGKARAARDGSARARRTWRLVYLSPASSQLRPR